MLWELLPTPRVPVSGSEMLRVLPRVCLGLTAGLPWLAVA